ncbi:MAG: aminopeptidase N [Actinomycetaceae bacterium]|nr:aminopeptidase N [Actinomycetaceae bacterium]
MPGQNLTHEEAIERGSKVTVYHYDVHLDLTGDDKTFTSTTVIDFDAHDGASTFVDLIAEKVNRIELNGDSVDTAAFSDSRVHLDNLAQRNKVTIEAVCNYMHTGEGLHRFTDPADGLDYCYSQFEVPDARRVFAVFEQPDMKAQFTFHVTAPSSWIVLSNSPSPEPVEAGEGCLRWDFSATEQMSSYITAIVAGPYVGETSTLVSSDGRTIPLGVYCRQSLREHLDAEWVFDVTRQGFAFFEKEYAHPYPFRKYDQIFVPEYNAGAMENAGCVTFRDQYIFRTQPTAADLEGLANTILHELAHMWFGDLVTMRWWNDLWLNESFAEFMSHLCLVEGTRQWPDAWTGFMARKEWGLTQDQLPSTHPIVAPIRDLADVEVNFDGITYAKGAAVLRQLVSYVGREPFFRALNGYFAEHAWSNTTLDDLMSKLEEASGRDLQAWSAVWLEEAGVTLLRPEVDVDEDGRVRELAVVQESFTAGSSLRPHRLAVAGYSEVDGQVRRVFHEELDVDGGRTVVSSAQGIERPELILVNDEDLAYAKIRLDEQGLDFATKHIANMPDALTRAIVLASAWDMVRDGQMSARAYCDLALSAIPAETDITMLGLLLRRIDTALTLYVNPQLQKEALETVGSRLLLLARAAQAGTDQQRLLVLAAARRAANADQAQAVERLRTGQDTLTGLNVDVDLRWSLLLGAVRTGVAGEEQIKQMELEDSTMTGAQRAARARAAMPTAQAKDAAFEAFLFDPSLSNDMRLATGYGYWDGVESNPSLQRPHVEKYFASLLQIWQDNTFHTASSMVLLAFPKALTGRVAQLDVVGLGQQWLDANEDAPAGLRRLLSELVDESERALRAQQLR